MEALQTLPERVTSLESQILQLRGEMRGEFSAIRERFDAIDQRFQTIDERFEETRRFMRVLHKEVLNRISLLQENRRPRKR